MAGTLDDMLRVARSQIGVKESPANSNKCKYTKWYGLVGPWCAMYVSWVAHEAGVPTSVIPKHAYTPDGAAFFQRRSQWGKKPKVGAIVYYEWPGMGRISHVGIVETVHSDGSWTAIEGNTDANGSRTGGQVMRRRRSSVGSRGGFGYPKYAAAPKKATAAAKAKPKPGTVAPKGWKLVKYGATLRKGTYGLPVGDVQKMLGITRDYAFGNDTDKYVRAFQRKHKLVIDGEVGNKTWTALKKYGKK